MLNDIEMGQKAKLRRISALTDERLSIPEEHLESCVLQGQQSLD